MPPPQQAASAVWQAWNRAVVLQGPPVTKLTAYFSANVHDPSARHILYPDFPRFSPGIPKTSGWHVSGACTMKTQGSLWETCWVVFHPSLLLNPHQAELYYLRMLLHNMAGALSFEDLWMVTFVYPFKRIAKAWDCWRTTQRLTKPWKKLLQFGLGLHLCDTTHLLQLGCMHVYTVYTAP